MQKLNVQNFRNLNELEMIPSGRMNVIYGKNAQGKTNLLEAVFLLSTLRSFRTSRLQETVPFGKSDTLLQATVQTIRSNHTLSLAFAQGEKVALLDRKKTDALHYMSVFHVFLFSFSMLEVVRGGPDERRRFLDRSISMTSPGYFSELIQYHRAVKQKNALLMMIQNGQVRRREGLAEIHSFNEQLAEHGYQVVDHRLRYLKQLQQLLREKQGMFFGRDQKLTAERMSPFQGSIKEMKEVLSAQVEKEMARGLSMVGPHRDEVRFAMDGRELRKYGSSGQHRAFLLLMLLAQMELYERWRQDPPVILLDDLDSELDHEKIRSFLAEVEGRYQTFISTSRRELFSGNSKALFFEIESGELRRSA